VRAGTLDLPVRSSRAIDALPPLPDPETAPPERSTVIRHGVVRIDRIDLEVGSESKSTFHIEEDDPLSAVAELWRSDIRAAPPDELKTKRFRS
jgi:uncharacterized protein